MIKNLLNLLYVALLSVGMAVCGASASTSLQQDESSRQLLEDLFTIRSISVDETARSASIAQQAAIDKAEQLAYQKLLEKITQPAGRDKLPALSKSEIQGLIRGIEVINEQSSSRRYLATYNIVFESEFVSDLLAFHQVPHVLSTGTGVAVIHAHRSGLTNYLWSPSGTLAAARASIDWENRVRLYSFPTGSVTDRFTVSQQNVSDLSPEPALKIASSYDLNSALLIFSEFLAGDNEGEIAIRYKFRLTDGDYVGEGTLFPKESQEDNELELITLMYKEVLERIDSKWREQLLVDTSESGSVTVMMSLESADTFGTITNILSELSLVKKYSIDRISIPLSQLSIDYTGRLEQLSLALSYNGLVLEEYGDKWLLRQKD